MNYSQEYNIYLRLLIPYCITGALLLAAIYHTILYYFGRQRLLAVYSMYLWACFLHISYDTFNFADPGNFSPAQLLTSDLFLIMANQLYIRFIATAFSVSSFKGGFIKAFYRSTYYILGAYFLAQVIVRLVIPSGAAIGAALYFIVWPLIIAGSTVWLCMLLRKKAEKFNKYIAAAAFLFILLGITAIVVSVIHPFDPHYMDKYHMDPFTYTCIGYFVEVLIFSGAMGLKLRQDLKDKLAADKVIISQQQLLLDNELGKQSEIIRSRRKERMAIAGDMHDEISNSLASLKFQIAYSRRSQEGKPAAILQDLEDEVESVYLQARSFMHSLHSNLESYDYDLMSFLKSLAAYGALPPLAISIDAEYNSIAGKLSPRQQNYLYLIIKEAVSLMLQQSGGGKMMLGINFEQEDCILKAESDKPFFTAGEAPQLKLISQWCGELSGVIHFDPEKGYAAFSVRFPA